MALSGIALVVPPSLPLNLVIQIAQQRKLTAIVVASEIKTNATATLFSLEDLQAAPANTALSSMIGTAVFIIKILPDKLVEYADALPEISDDPKRGIPPISKGGEIELSPSQPSAPRVVNASIYYADGEIEPVPATVSLAVAGVYTLRVNIGARKAESRLPSDAPAIPTPPMDEKGLDLFVALATSGTSLQFASTTQVLHLPHAGDSDEIMFNFTAKEAAADVPLWIHVYYNWVLLQTIELHLAITPTEQDITPLATTVQYTRTTGFNDLEALRPNEIVLTMIQTTNAYQLTATWSGDGTGGRRNPKRGLAVSLPINANDLVQAISAARNTLYDTTWQPSYRQGARGKLAERREALYQIAVAGNRLYATLFHPAGATPEQARELEALRVWLEAMTTMPVPGQRPAMQIVSQNLPSGIPWGMLYPDAITDPNDVDANKFWGCRYRLEIMTSVLADNAKQPPPARSGINVRGGTYNFRVPNADNVIMEVTKDHRQALSDLATQQPKLNLDLRESATQPDLATLLGDSDIVYMFCHGHTAKTQDDTSDWVARFKDQMARLSPETREKYGDLFKLEQQEYQPTDPNIGDSWLKWNSSLFPLRLLSQWNLKLPRKPLVMLNMCESAQVLPTLSAGFIPFFSQIGARGVLGTECPMLAPFAAAFGQKLIEQLANGEKIGDVLPALRLHFIEEERNPLGLAYTYYGDANLGFGG